ncbi:BrnA antitoxin family protein [Methylococcus sp. Mc7]|uniref:BrnA antitoxin family protein n=1 Tax=Methylococcus sp. Mc7 TaxID=2860258 RepID=UPI001C5297E9|nr:BrnA antitoxin family protein [Methylococcus sp. Mc7]QXP85663.1 BrnA antitoxin family protein [Methylococcus sp. Mc7]
MQKFLTLRNGRKVLLNTPEEDAAITAAALSDPDAAPLTDEEWEAVKPLVRRGRRPAEAPKERITIRLSRDVVDRFKATGPGWQTRIDAALADWLKEHRPE